MLYQLPGIGKEAAQPIIAMHPTLAEVIGALTANGNEPNDITNNGSSSSSSSANNSNSSGTSSGSLVAGVGCEGREGMSDDHPMAGSLAAHARAIGDSRTPTKRSKPTAIATATAITPSPRIPANTNVPPPTNKKRKAGPEPLVFPSCGPHKNNVLKTFFCTYF